MSKFKVKFKITGLEFEIEGSREDVPLISRNLASQFGGMFTPAANIVQGSSPALGRDPIEVTPAAPISGSGRSNRRTSRRVSAADVSKPSKVFDWNHNVQEWGSPAQAWNPLQKSIWLLYVAKAQGVTTEMTTSQIANTFNKHFRQSGVIRPSNVSRDLGKAKTLPPSKVGEDSTKDPSTWFLTEQGEKTAVELVSEGRGLKAT
jgi:hypothetical protein